MSIPDQASHKARYYPESAFGGFTDIDGTIAFYSRVNALLEPSFRVIDFGCGRGAHAEDPIPFRRSLRWLKGKAARVIGVDVDLEAAQANPAVDEFRSLPADGTWPLGDKSAEMIVSDFVVEHLPNPAQFFSEAARVLVLGGYLCIRTPNVLSYVGIASRIMPNQLHRQVLQRVQTGRKAEDVFPTLYRCNTVSGLRRQMAKHGFRAAVYGYEAEPSYLDFSGLAYLGGVLHQKWAPSFMRPAILAFGQLTSVMERPE